MDNNQGKSKLPTIDMKIEVEVVDDSKPKMSEKRKAFIREKNKRIYRRFIVFFVLAAIGSAFISNVIVSCASCVVCVFLALCFWGAYKDQFPQEHYGYTPWWYYGL